VSKKDTLKETVCLQFCSYYKPGRNEELSCGGYERIERFLEEGRKVAIEVSGSCGDAGQTEAIVRAICRRCGFREDGCDFMLDRKSPPCGGFRLISQLIADGMLQIEDL
jgi:hypothetical protein